MSKKCPKCESKDIHITHYPSSTGNMVTCYGCGYADLAERFPEQTLFDTITASRRLLAEKLVYPTYGIISRTWDFEKDDWGTAEPSWSSTVLSPDLCFSTKEDAIAATIKELEKELK